MENISKFLQTLNHRLEQENKKIKVIDEIIEQQLEIVKKIEHDRKVVEKIMNQSIAKWNFLKGSEGNCEPRNCAEERSNSRDFIKRH